MAAHQSSSVKIFNASIPFLIVLIFATVFGSFFYYIIQPELQKYLPGGPIHYDSIKELLASRTAYQNDLQSLTDFVQQASQNAQDPIALVLPSNQEIPTLYALFEKIAKDVGVGLQVIDISQLEESADGTKGKIATVSIDLRFVNVDYETLKRLIGVLESNIRLTTIETLSYDPMGNTVGLTVRTYYFRE